MLGEIVVQGESLAYGYWNPDQKKIIPFNGDYFFTGDLGYKIKNGIYFLLGRKDRIVKIHGIRINLDEIEDCILRIEGIADAAVVHSASGNSRDEIDICYELIANVFLTSKDIERRLVLPCLEGKLKLTTVNVQKFLDSLEGKSTATKLMI